MRRRFGIVAVVAVAASCSSFSAESDGTAGNDGGASDATATDGGPITGKCMQPLDEGWSTPKRLADLRGAKGERYFVDPFVTADGLTLFLVNGSGPDLRVYRANRSSRVAPWSTATPLEGFTNPTYAPPYPTSANPDAELIVAGEAIHTDMFELVPGDSGTWTGTVIEALERPDVDLSPTLTADGLMLVYQEVSANDQQNPFRALFEATRATATPGSPWDKRGLASPPYDGGPGDVAWHHPALTPNGLGLFYAVDGKDDVFFVTRKTRDDDFFSDTATSVTIPSLASAGFTTRVRSVTADGCEMYLTSNREDGVLDAYVATRTP